MSAGEVWTRANGIRWVEIQEVGLVSLNDGLTLATIGICALDTVVVAVAPVEFLRDGVERDVSWESEISGYDRRAVRAVEICAVDGVPSIIAKIHFPFLRVKGDSTEARPCQGGESLEIRSI